MNNFQIETAQNITIQHNVASVITRIGAYLIDFGFIIVYYLLAFIFFALINVEVSMDNMTLIILMMLPVMFYSLAFEVFMNGQTPGKYFTKIRVVKLDGSKPTLGSYVIRWFLRLIDISLFSGSVAALTILLNGKGQRLGDIAAGTSVIKITPEVSLKDTLISNVADDDYSPTFAQVTLLSDKDAQTIRHLFLDAKRKGNHKVILKLSNKIKEITGIKTDMLPMNFVDIVIKDYYHLTK